jgi:hypothetical protein
MRGLKRLRWARVISTGHAFVQNIRRGHYELGVDLDPRHCLPEAFTELALAIWLRIHCGSVRLHSANATLSLGVTKQNC